jgi:hypothetical protein
MIRYLAPLLFALPSVALAVVPKVTAIHCPDGGIQPQAAVDSTGKVHLVYLKGDEKACDVLYVTSADGGKTWSKPIPAASQPGSAMAVGTVRGAQIALGKNDRPHVIWFGSKEALPTGPGGATPLLYSRLDATGKAFETQRNLITSATGLDGGGSVAADNAGNVYVAWHAPIPGRTGEANRTVWLAVSKDDGATFAPETQMLGDATGACGCCGMRLALDPNGKLNALYRAANSETRDIYLLSPGPGGTYPAEKIEPFATKTCPMSTISMTRFGSTLLAAWDNGGEISVEALDSRSAGTAHPPGTGRNRKHPSVAVSKDNYVLVAWTEGTAWKQGGSLHWQIFDRSLKPFPGESGEAPKLAVWSLPTAFATADGFVIVY